MAPLLARLVSAGGVSDDGAPALSLVPFGAFNTAELAVPELLADRIFGLDITILSVDSNDRLRFLVPSRILAM